LSLECLEERSLMTIAWYPAPGQAPTFDTSHDKGNRLSDSPIYLIFWGNGWQDSQGNPIQLAKDIQTDVTALIDGSPFLSPLTEYGSTGRGFIAKSVYYLPSNFKDSVTPGPTVGVAGNGEDTDVEKVVSTLIDLGGSLDLNQLPEPDDKPPNLPSGYTKYSGNAIYVVFTLPGVQHARTQPGGTQVLGKHFEDDDYDFPLDFDDIYEAVVTNPNTVNANYSYNQLLADYTRTFGHEVMEAMTDPDQDGLGFTNGDEICDGPASTHLHTITGTDPVSQQAISLTVQAVWSKQDQAYVIADGSSIITHGIISTPGPSQLFRITGTSLTVKGDQLTNSNDTVTLDVASDGGLSVNLNGEAVHFNPGEITSVSTPLGYGNDTVNLLHTIPGITYDISGANLTLGTFNVGAGASVTVHNTTVGGQAPVVSGTLTLANVTLNAPLTDQGTVIVAGYSALNGTPTVAAAATLRVEDGTTTVASGFANDGTIDLTSTVANSPVTLAVTSGTLVNDAGGTITVSPGAGGTRSLAAAFDNRGKFAVEQPLALTLPGVSDSNSGTLSVDHGDLTFDAVTFTNLGAVTLSAGRTMSFPASSTYVQNGGTLGGPGTLALTGAVLQAAADFNDAAATTKVTSGADVTGPGTWTIATGSAATLNGATVDTTMAVRGTVVATGNDALNAAPTVAAGGTLRVQDGTLTVASGFANDGTIDLTASTPTGTADLSIPAGTLVNDKGGTVIASASAGANGQRTLDAPIDNLGTFDIEQPLALRRATVNDAGGTMLVNGGDLTVALASGAFVNRGTVTIAAGRTFNVPPGATYDQAGGTVNGAGTLALTSATLYIAADFSDAAAVTKLTYGMVNGPGALIIPAGRVLLFNGASGDAPVVDQGTVIATAGTIGGPLSVAAKATFRVLDGTLYATSGLTNDGTVDLTTDAANVGAALTVQGGPLTNDPGASLTASPGAGGNRTLSAALVNRGTVEVGRALTVYGQAGSANAGTITVDGGDLSYQASVGNLVNRGAVTVAAGRTLTFSNGALYQSGGTVSGAGTLALTSAALDLPADGSLDIATTRVNYGTVNGPGALTVSPGRVLLLNGSAGDAALVDKGTVVATNASLGGPVSVAAGATLRSLDGTFTASGGLTNDGTIDLTTDNPNASAALAVTGGPLTNDAGATLTASPGSGGNRSVTAALVNRGTVEAGKSLTVYAQVGSANSGTITVDGGDLTVQTSGSGNLVNRGAVTVAAGRTLTFYNGALYQFGGTISGAGTLALTSAALDLPADGSLDVATTHVNNGSINGPGVLTVPAGRVLTLSGSTGDAAVTVKGMALVTGGATIGGPVSVAAGATLRVLDSTLSANSGLTNDGTVDLTTDNTYASASLTVANEPLVNDPGATLTASPGAGGYRTLSAALVNRGTVEVGRALTLYGQPGTANSGTITVDGGDLTYSNQWGSAGLVNRGTLTVASGRKVTVGNGTFTNYGTTSLAAGGTLTLYGGFVQPASGVLSLGLAGPPAGGMFGRLSVSGTATLGGTLKVALSGYTPAPTDVFPVMTFSSRTGDFATRTGLAFGGGKTLRVVYSNGGMSLQQ
jgi:adhesin HecA-like repeat protein